MVSRAEQEILIQSTELTSPSLKYNSAVVKAFQESAKRAILPLGHADNDCEVVLLAGSFGKGVGHFWSDLDIVDVVRSNRSSCKWIYQFTQHIPETFEQALKEPRFRDVTTYIAVAKEIERRSQERRQKVVKNLKLEGINYDPNYSSIQEYEDFLYEFALPGEFKSIIEQMDPLFQYDIKKPRIAERLSKKVLNIKTEIPKFPHSISVDSVEGVYESGSIVMNSFEVGIRDIQTVIDHPELMVSVWNILTATPGWDAYEVTKGNLSFHQRNLLRALRDVYKQGPRHPRFRIFEDKLAETWWEYQERTMVKYGKLYWDLKKNRQGLVYVYHPILEEMGLPTPREFEQSITRK